MKHLLIYTHQHAVAVRFCLQHSQFHAAEQNPVWNKTWQYSTPYLEKEKKIMVQRGKDLSMLLFPLPFARKKENGNRESRILIDCATCTMIPVHILPTARKRLSQTRSYSQVLQRQLPIYIHAVQLQWVTYNAAELGKSINSREKQGSFL